MPAQSTFDIAEPRIELFSLAAVHRRKRADHAIAASGDHKLNAGDQKHRCRDQRQAETIAKARERIGCMQRPWSLLAFAANIGTIEGR
jgi:hypothetical protein